MNGNSQTKTILAAESLRQFEQAYAEFESYHFNLIVAKVAADRSMDQPNGPEVDSVYCLGGAKLEDGGKLRFC